ncbi:uncharacterized ACR protein [Clostridium sp. SY8519]|uniref:peptidoglycan editing factor PgeF n=1 Tax=Clostridium sp. (strain SY8519) TaxID=1042156 RepID=UPI0002171A0E|nr:peptidoglycan editing factor PgeF [Clostridium sp. SY8519]BAK48064.1 uncharacterized ACR protein [Clostridium sp. SY8519]
MFTWKTGSSIPEVRHHSLKNGTELPVLVFPALERTGMVRQAFSTRLGGVSEGIYATMNLKFELQDDPSRVMENYRRIAEALGTAPDRFVVSAQTHTACVRRVTEEDAGKGVTRLRDYTDVDGLVTDVPGLVLVTQFADCVPLYFVDPVRRAIGLSHSGWKGTVQRMGQATVRRMQEEFGTDPADLICAIGPSICQSCYEVSEDVADQFFAEFPSCGEEILQPGAAGRYQLNLWEANRRILMEAGVPGPQISVTGLCTCCNRKLLFSHRATQGKRGNLAAFLGLK